MVFYEDNEGPTEIPFETEVFGRNSNFFESEPGITEMDSVRDSQTADCDIADNVLRKRKMRKKSSKTVNPCSSTGSQVDSTSNTEITAEDLLELRTVYKRCKSVIKKIESKYGHLLNSSDTDSDCLEPPYEKRSRSTEDDFKIGDECQCLNKKKIVFDDDGKEVLIDTLPENHICPTKSMYQKNYTLLMNSENKNIQIEYHNKEIELSDNLLELRRILQNPDIETTYRNQVIDKLKFIRQEQINEIRFKKHSLIEKLKINPDEIFNFNGANLSQISGYSFY